MFICQLYLRHVVQVVMLLHMCQNTYIKDRREGKKKHRATEQPPPHYVSLFLPLCLLTLKLRDFLDLTLDNPPKGFGWWSPQGGGWRGEHTAGCFIQYVKLFHTSPSLPPSPMRLLYMAAHPSTHLCAGPARNLNQTQSASWAIHLSNGDSCGFWLCQHVEILEDMFCLCIRLKDDDMFYLKVESYRSKFNFIPVQHTFLILQWLFDGRYQLWNEML